MSYNIHVLYILWSEMDNMIIRINRQLEIFHVQCVPISYVYYLDLHLSEVKSSSDSWPNWPLIKAEITDYDKLSTHFKTLHITADKLTCILFLFHCAIRGAISIKLLCPWNSNLCISEWKKINMGRKWWGEALLQRIIITFCWLQLWDVKYI